MLETLDSRVRRMRPGGDGDVKDWSDILIRQARPNRTGQISAMREDSSQTGRNNPGHPRRSKSKDNCSLTSCLPPMLSLIFGTVSAGWTPGSTVPTNASGASPRLGFCIPRCGPDQG